MRAPQALGDSMFSSPSDEFLNNSITVQNEDMLHNWTDRASMSIFKVGKPFRATKEMHLAIVQALIMYCKKHSYQPDPSIRV
jgi:hypothetical protein